MTPHDDADGPDDVVTDADASKTWRDAMSRRTLAGLRTIITGASSGIGEAVARELNRQGADLLLVARREDRLSALTQQLCSHGSGAIYRVGDMTSGQVRTETLKAAQDELGGLDLLINNAGVGAIGPFVFASEERLRRVMEVNFFAPARVDASCDSNAAARAIIP